MFFYRCKFYNYEIHENEVTKQEKHNLYKIKWVSVFKKHYLI